MAVSNSALMLCFRQLGLQILIKIQLRSFIFDVLVAFEAFFPNFLLEFDSESGNKIWDSNLNGYSETNFGI